MAATFMALPAEIKDTILEEMKSVYLKDPDVPELTSHTGETFDSFMAAAETTPAFWPIVVGSTVPLTLYFLDNAFTLRLFDESLSVKQNIERLKKYMYNCIIISKLYDAFKSEDFFSRFSTYLNGHRVEFMPMPKIKSLRISEVVDVRAESGYLLVMGHPEFKAVVKRAFPNPDLVITISTYFEIKLLNMTDSDTFNSELHIGWSNGFKCCDSHGASLQYNFLPRTTELQISDFSKGIFNSWIQTCITADLEKFIEKYNLV